MDLDFSIGQADLIEADRRRNPVTNFFNPPFSVNRPRIGVTRSNIPVRVNHSIGGFLADLGPDGISIVTQSPLQIGRKISIEFETFGHHIQGDFEVQFMCLMPNGRIRSRLGLMKSDCSSTGSQLEQLTILLRHHGQDKPNRAA
ncbi:MAG: hypothetical protein KatS3mg104_2253 [Phycisphaerae bacterium]|nr:MAG: hypothetical protein KatS3mg104_2253 [Phycisphaerae bacterium]